VILTRNAELATDVSKQNSIYAFNAQIEEFRMKVTLYQAQISGYLAEVQVYQGKTNLYQTEVQAAVSMAQLLRSELDHLRRLYLDNFQTYMGSSPVEQQKATT
jgi:hypothetical protein